MHLKRLTLVFIALLWVFPAVAAKKDELPKTDGWIAVTTDHFTIYSHANKNKTVKSAIRLERFRQVLDRISRGFKLDSDVPTAMHVFKNDYVYERYKTRPDGDVRNVSGLFVTTEFQNLMSIDISAGSDSMRVMLHEYFHSVTSNSIGEVPTWLDEGLAEYFSTFKYNDISNSAELGAPIRGHLNHIEAHGLIPWDDVFSTTPSSPTYNEGTRQGGFYAQSWILTHYLNSSRERIGQLGAYLQALRLGIAEEEAFVKAFGVGKAEFAQLAQNYFATGIVRVAIDFNEEFPKVEPVVREMERKETLFRLGNLLAHFGPYDDAHMHLAAAKELGWPEADVSNSLAISHFYTKNEAAANEMWEKAIEQGATMIQPYARIALKHQNQATGMSAGVPPELLEARKTMERGLPHDDSNFLSLVIYASTFLFGDTDVSPGLEAIAKAREQRPLDLYGMVTHAPLLAFNGEVDKAFKLTYETILPRSKPHATEAERGVLYAVRVKINEHLKQSEYEEAEALVDAAMGQLRDAGERADLLRWRENFRNPNAIMVTASEDVEQNAFVQDLDKLNSAIRMMNDSQFDQAEPILTTLSTECADQKICDRAKSLLIDLAKVRKYNSEIDEVNRAVQLVNDGKIKQGRAILEKILEQTDEQNLASQIQEMLKQLR